MVQNVFILIDEFSGCGYGACGASASGSCSTDCLCFGVSHPPLFWPRGRTGAVHPRHWTGNVKSQWVTHSLCTEAGASTGEVNFFFFSFGR